MEEFDDGADLRYLQDEAFFSAELAPWNMPQNKFERRLASNLRPRHTLILNANVLARILGGAALLADPKVITVQVRFVPKSEYLHVEVMTILRQELAIYADDAGNFLPALRWYQSKGVKALQVAVCAPRFFWFKASTGTHAQRES